MIDQSKNIIWVHPIRSPYFCQVFSDEDHETHVEDFKSECVPYIPQSKYLELETKLKIAREALEKLDALLDPDMGHSEINEASDIVQEALSKLQTKEGDK